MGTDTLKLASGGECGKLELAGNGVTVDEMICVSACVEHGEKFVATLNYMV